MDSENCLRNDAEPRRKPLTSAEYFVLLHSQDLYNFPASEEDARNICKDLRMKRMLVELQGLACAVLHEQRYKKADKKVGKKADKLVYSIK